MRFVWDLWKPAAAEIQAGKFGEKWTASGARLRACVRVLCSVAELLKTYFQEMWFASCFQSNAYMAWDFKQTLNNITNSFPRESPETEVTKMR